VGIRKSGPPALASVCDPGQTTAPQEQSAPTCPDAMINQDLGSSLAEEIWAGSWKTLVK
jgi:hypothetical protein